MRRKTNPSTAAQRSAARASLMARNLLKSQQETLEAEAQTILERQRLMAKRQFLTDLRDELLDLNQALLDGKNAGDISPAVADSLRSSVEDIWQRVKAEATS
jgi:transposase